MHYDKDDWDFYGFPGEYIYGDNFYVDDAYMEERWKPVVNVPHYFVSDHGRLYSSISQSFIYGTPVGRCGHIDVCLKLGGERIHRYIHRLVAEAFIPNPYNYPLVRHLDDDPSNNYVGNLRWGTQADNMQDAINNNSFYYLHDDDRELAMQKRRMPVTAIRFSDGKRMNFESQCEAARILGVNQGDIYKTISGKGHGSKGYYFIKQGGKLDGFEVAKKTHSRKKPLIKAINIRTGEEIIFEGLTAAADCLDMSIASVSNVLRNKTLVAKGWRFKYVEEV